MGLKCILRENLTRTPYDQLKLNLSAIYMYDILFMKFNIKEQVTNCQQTAYICISYFICTIIT